MNVIKWYKNIMKKSLKVGNTAGSYAGYKLKQNMDNIQLICNSILDLISIVLIAMIMYKVGFNLIVIIFGLHLEIVLISTLIQRIKTLQK